MKSSSFQPPPEPHYFAPEDIAAMRHAYHAACQERPLAADTEAQRLTLAKAIVVVYNPIFSEPAMVAAAWLLVE
jgi:hypothetical protein